MDFIPYIDPEQKRIVVVRNDEMSTNLRAPLSRKMIAQLPPEDAA